MAYTFNGTDQWLSTAANSITTVAPTPATLACAMRPLSDPTDSSVRTLMALCNTYDSASIHWLYRYSNSTRIYYHSNVEAAVGGSLTQNAWSFGAGVNATQSSRTAYINGYAGTEDTRSGWLFTPGMLHIAKRLSYSASYANDDIGEAAVWNVALTADEIWSLAKGFPPRRIRPQSLVFYAPLTRNLIDVRGGIAITNNGNAGVVDHNRRYG